MSYLFYWVGANLTPADIATRDGCEAALAAGGGVLPSGSNWYETAPVPISDQPWYLNAVALARQVVMQL